MTRRDRIKGLLIVALAVLAFKLVAGLWQWFAYADERRVLYELRAEVVEAGSSLFVLQLRADTLRRALAADDAALEKRRHRVERYGRYTRDGGLPPGLYGAYRRELDEYNARVEWRNRRLRELEEILLLQEASAERYQALAERTRAHAARMGEPYFPLPLPVEAAAERGIISFDTLSAGRP
jgi:hypothetical protein